MSKLTFDVEKTNRFSSVPCSRITRSACWLLSLLLTRRRRPLPVRRVQLTTPQTCPLAMSRQNQAKTFRRPEGCSYHRYRDIHSLGHLRSRRSRKNGNRVFLPRLLYPTRRPALGRRLCWAHLWYRSGQFDDSAVRKLETQDSSR